MVWGSATPLSGAPDGLLEGKASGLSPSGGGAVSGCEGFAFLLWALFTCGIGFSAGGAVGGFGDG